MSKLDLRAFISIILIILCASCTGSKEIKNIGVSIETEKGIREIVYYAEQKISSEECYPLDKLPGIVSASVIKAIYLNIPEANISSTKLYDCYNLKGRTFYPNLKEWHTEYSIPLPISIEKMKNGVYKIVCNELKDKRDTGAFLILLVRMPLGIPNRAYPIFNFDIKKKDAIISPDDLFSSEDEIKNSIEISDVQIKWVKKENVETTPRFAFFPAITFKVMNKGKKPLYNITFMADFQMHEIPTCNKQELMPGKTTEKITLISKQGLREEIFDSFKNSTDWNPVVELVVHSVFCDSTDIRYITMGRWKLPKNID